MGKVDHREFYSREAAQYESTRYGSRYGSLFRALQRDAVQRALESVPSPQLILDVASGTGQMLPVLRSSGAVVVASDLTPEMLAEARGQSKGLDAIVYCVGDALALPYPDQKFDVVASSRFLHLFDLDTQLLLLKEMVRVLKPGGTLIVDFYSTHGRRWVWLPMAVYRALRRKRPENDVRVTLQQARDMVRACGLQPTAEEGIGNFLLALIPWSPIGLRARFGKWLGRNFLRMSEQFLIASRAP